MFLPFIVILGVLGKCTAIPLSAIPQNEVDTRNPALEALIWDLLEDLRETMVTGSDDVPVLDPLQLELVEIDDNDIDIPGLSLVLHDVECRHLSTFDVHSLSVNYVFPFLTRYAITFDGSIPLLEADAREYELDVEVDGFPIFGKGEGSVQLIQPGASGRIVVGVRLTIGNGLFLNVFSADIRFRLEGFKSDIRGIFYDDAASDFVNIFLGYLVPDLVVHYEDEISEFLNEFIPEVANDILHDLDLSDIFG